MAWERREKGEMFPTSNPRERKKNDYEDILCQNPINISLSAITNLPLP
jgi:hypothetical protein